ncbi:copper chaperone PCu(A)C [Solimonas terrae]|uniref:Copper chaperone PCu(A)C n=1 Tax=Solimonas terrae TaxID=1396819 RepID=A0A6M2BPA0_9GAMM|nr:copper chaperone PCu(A)C [Solimonas terrae]NGY04298.1 copper chaperone PCu(A)C [Solimonas terrae]
MKIAGHPILSAAALLLASSAAVAAQPASPVVENAWIRMLPGDLPAAGYFDLRNRSDASRKLVSADSPAFMMTMLHQSSEQNGQSQMQHVDDVALPAHGVVHFAPGSYHLMLMQAKNPLTVGEHIPVSLQFSDGSSVKVEFVVRPAGASGP